MTKGIYEKRGVLYFRVKVGGKWKGIATEFKAGEEKRAASMLERFRSEIERGVLRPGGPLTVAAYVDTWIEQRKLDVGGWKNDHALLRDHVLPTIGAMRIGDVRARHLVELARAWRLKGLAPRSRRNVYSVCCALFRDAQIADLIEQSPCVLRARELGAKVDKNSEWRASAVFNRDELERLISDTRIPADRRLVAALAGIGALRHGEVAGLRWRHIDSSTKPLGRLLVATSYDKGSTKTGATRFMPVHPTLAAMLAQWRAAGWEREFGRAPTADDLVVPRDTNALRPGAMRSKQYTLHLFQRDLDLLGLRRRRFHDLRRTAISLYRADGATKEILARGTHAAPTEVIELYTTVDFEVLCREVIKLEVHRRDLGQVVRFAVGQRPPSELATRLATAKMKPSKSGRNLMLGPGLEPHPTPPENHEEERVTRGVSALSDVGESSRSTDQHDFSDEPGSTVASGFAELVALFSETE